MTKRPTPKPPKPELGISQHSPYHPVRILNKQRTARRTLPLLKHLVRWRNVLYTADTFDLSGAHVSKLARDTVKRAGWEPFNKTAYKRDNRVCLNIFEACEAVLREQGVSATE